jgi:hypothetical protein
VVDPPWGGWSRAIAGNVTSQREGHCLANEAGDQRLREFDEPRPVPALGPLPHQLMPPLQEVTWYRERRLFPYRARRATTG